LNNFQSYYDNFPALTANIGDADIIIANRSLIEILISNLVNNAIIHNKADGKINISLQARQLVIENTGAPLEVETEELFERFKKGSYHGKTTGLGLSLAKQICQLYHYEIRYRYNNDWHTLQVNFR
jgi:signal transduction histidine kinase